MCGNAPLQSITALSPYVADEYVRMYVRARVPVRVR